MFWIDREKYCKSLETYANDNPNAKEQNKESCQNSGNCCLRRPAEINNEELSKLAQHFKITEKEFFSKYCMVDQLGNGYVIIFRRHHQEGGTWVTIEESWNAETPCVFRETNSCTIHDVKPRTCRKQKCWEKPTQHDVSNWEKEDLMNLGWNGITDE